MKRILKNLFFIFINLQCFAQQDAALTIVHALDRVNIPQENLVNHVQRDANNNLWLCSNYGVYRYTGYTTTKYLMHDGLGDNLVFGSFEDSKHRIWFRTYNGKITYYLNGKIHNRNNEKLCDALDFNSIIVGIVERNGKIAFASQTDGLKILENDKIVTVEIKVIKQIYWEDDENLKIITSVGIYNYNLKKKKLDCITYLNWGSKYTSMVAKNGTVLLTYGSEVYRFENNILTFLFALEYPTHEIICMEQYDQNNYIFGTRNGIIVYNVVSKKIDSKYFGKAVPCINKDIDNHFWMSIEDKGAFNIKKIEDLNLFISKIQDISCLFRDSAKNIWVGTKVGNVIRFSPDGTEKVFDFFSATHRKDKVTQILETKDHQIIVIDKLFIGTIAGDKITFVSSLGGNEACIDNEKQSFWIRSIQLGKYSLAEGTISKTDLITVNKKLNALCFYNKKVYAATNQEFGQIINDSFVVLAKVDNIITDINEKYVLTNFGTIYELTNNGLKKLPFNPPARLSCERLIIKGQKLYLCTNQGFFIYDLRNFSSRYVNSFRSLAISDIIIDERHAFIGTNYGLFKVPLSFLVNSENPNEIKASFTSILTSKKAIQQLEQIEIPYNERDLTINFSIKSFFLQPAIYYKIDDKEWVKTKNFYIPTHLDPGIHKVLLYVRTDEIPKASGAESLTFEILKPFWQTWWFIMLSIAILAAAFYAMYVFWTYRVKREYELIKEEENKKYEKLALENEVILLEQKALRMQMNPHFIFNAINTFKGFYAEKNERDGSKYINNFSKLLRNILENENFINPLSKEIEIAENYLKMMQVKYPNFTYSINQNQIATKSIGLPSMMIQPFVENAIIHGIGPKNGIGHITINIELTDLDKLEISIIDNGLGVLGSNSLHQSKSFSITSKRLKIFNADEPFELVLANNSNGTGAVLTILTKYKKL